MKKLSLDETWDLCLQMWKWIAYHKSRKNDYHSVFLRKDKWLHDNKFKDGDVLTSCFFCEYVSKRRRRKSVDCSLGNGADSLCPAAKIDEEFCCMNSEYHYADYPIQFYKKLLQLNKKRLEG